MSIIESLSLHQQSLNSLSTEFVYHNELKNCRTNAGSQTMLKKKLRQCSEGGIVIKKQIKHAEHLALKMTVIRMKKVIRYYYYCYCYYYYNNYYSYYSYYSYYYYYTLSLPLRAVLSLFFLIVKITGSMCLQLL